MKKSNKQQDQSNIKVLEFLDAYQKYEILWNPAMKNYTNIVARESAYMNIINDLNLPNLTVNDIKLKVKSIRSTYTKELQRLIKSKQQGKTYKPTLFWFKRADSFLKDVSLSRGRHSTLGELMHNSKKYKSSQENTPDNPARVIHVEDCNYAFIYSDPKAISDNVAIETNVNNPTELNASQNHMELLTVQEQSYQPITSFNSNITTNAVSVATTTSNITPTLSIDGMKLISSIEEDFCATLPINNNNDYNNQEYFNVNATINTDGGATTTFIDDEFDAFCRSIAAQLRSVSDSYARSVAKLKIQQIVFEAENGHYRNAPCITVPTLIHI